MFILKVVVGVAFLLAGIAKLVGAKPLADQFREFGLPSWLMYLVGFLEVAGAVGLFVDLLCFWAATGLAGLMVGATANHIKARHSLDKVVPSLLLFLLGVAIAVFSFQGG